jgi:molecular chaperone HtpG
MHRVVAQRHLAEEARASLSAEADATAARVAKLLRFDLTAKEPLSQFKPQVRAAYEQVIGLIYECSSNRSAAKALVTKLLAKLEALPAKQAASKRAQARKNSRRRARKS